MKRRKQFLSILITICMVVVMLPAGMATARAENVNSGVSGTKSASYQSSKYTDLKTRVGDFSGNVGIMLDVLMKTEGHDSETAEKLRQIRNRLVSLSDESDQVAADVSDYYSGNSDELSFSIDENEIESNVLKLAEEMGDRSGAKRDYDVITADCNASVHDSRTAIKNNNMKTAERALLEYADAVETVAKCFEAAGLTTAYSEMDQYDEKYKDSSLYQSYDESQISSATESFSNLCCYYEWLLYYYKLTDYRNYLSDHRSEDPAEENILQKIDQYTFEDVKKTQKVIYEELFPYFHLFPDDDSEIGGITDIFSDSGGADQSEGSAFDAKTEKYHHLLSAVNGFSVSIDSMLRVSDNHDTEMAEKLHQIRNRLVSLSDNIDEAAADVSDYYSGKTDQLSFQIEKNEVASRVLALAVHAGDPETAARDFSGSSWGGNSPAYGAPMIEEMRTGIEPDCIDADSLSWEAVNNNHLKKAMNALFAYADGMEKAADVFKAVGLENCFDEISNYKENYRNPSAYQDFDENEISSATESFVTLCCYFEWLFDYYQLVDYGNYVSDHLSDYPTAVKTLQQIDLYTFQMLQKTGRFCIDELIPRFTLLSGNSQYDRLASVVSEPVAADLVYNGSEQQLLQNPGEAEGGLFLYAVSKSEGNVPDDEQFGVEIPSKKRAGLYYVWFKVKGDRDHIDSGKKRITVSIENSPDSDTGKAIQLVKDGIASNLEEGCNTEKAAKIWFGQDGVKPWTWYMIDYNGEEVAGENGTAVLLAEKSMGTTVFGSDSHYKGSELHEKIEDIVKNLTDQEEKALKARTLRDVEGDPVENALMWPLSMEEAKKVESGLRAIDPAYWDSAENNWWLRSPIENHPSFVALVAEDGSIQGIEHYGCIGVRPAFQLNMNSVLFTSAAGHGKDGTNGSLAAVKEYTGTDWKLTLLDSSRKFSVTEKSATVNPGDTVTLNYENATVSSDAAPDEYISAILADKKGHLLYYGRLLKPAEADGEVRVSLPDELKYGEYTLKMFSEQYNGDYKTDYASRFSDVELKLQSPEQACPRDDTCPIAPFSDTDRNAWYHDGVHWAVSKAVMYGTGNNTFEPMTSTTRAMIVTMLWRMEGSPVVDYQMSFKDVYKGQWYTEAIRWAASEGIVTGYNENSFGTDDPVNREQLAAILYRSAQAKGRGFHGSWALPLNFEDADQVSVWADEAMHWMVMAGVINGVSATELSPKSDAVRAQVATMLMRFENLI